MVVLFFHGKVMLIKTYLHSFDQILTDKEVQVLKKAGVLKLNITEAKRFLKESGDTKEGRLLARVLDHREKEAVRRLEEMKKGAEKKKKQGAAGVMGTDSTYPRVDDDAFGQKLVNMPQVLAHQSPMFPVIRDMTDLEARTQDACQRGQTGQIELMMHQKFVAQLLSEDTPYKGLLLYHQVGVGKTCSAIAVAEGYFAKYERQMKQPPAAIVIASRSLHSEFSRQIFDLHGSSCYGDYYRERALAMDPTLEGETLKNKVAAILRTRYLFLGYEEFAHRIQDHPEEFNGRLVIVDEVHNMRKSDAAKQAAVALEGLAKEGQDNILVFMTATPMYNESSEIYQLLAWLCWNDKREKEAIACLKAQSDPVSEGSKKLLGKLSSQYISYLRGTNPVAFPHKLDARVCLDGADVRDPRAFTESGGWRSAAVPESERNWPEYLPGIVLAPMSRMQREVLGSEAREHSITALNQELAYNNIVFPGPRMQHKEGLLSGMYLEDGVFRSKEDSFLGEFEEHAPKLAKVLDVAEKCEGISIIYSQYIWNGILPLALALEHKGYQNSTGKNLLDPKEPGRAKAKRAKYAILCGDTNFSPANLSGILREINAEANKNGEKIKFVLISQVASEGISFKNVRSVHIVDPWFHFHRTEQIIGRAVRTCSHVALPVADRNVGIFIYALMDPKTRRETADLYTLRMAAMKRREMEELRHVIQMHAVDCYLHRGRNWIPPSAPIAMKTPTGKEVQVVFGEEETDPFVCMAVPQRHRFMLDDFTPLELSRWSRYFMGNMVRMAVPGKWTSLEDLKSLYEHRVPRMLLDYTMALLVTQPYAYNKNTLIRIHNGKYKVEQKGEVHGVEERGGPRVLLKSEPRAKQQQQDNTALEEAEVLKLESLLRKIADPMERLVVFFGKIEYPMMNWILHPPNAAKIPVIYELLDSTGTWVYDAELEGRPVKKDGGMRVGYFDIFHVEPRLDKEVHPLMYIWSSRTQHWIEAPWETIQKVIKVRAGVAKRLPKDNAVHMCAGFVVRQRKGSPVPEMRLKMFDLTPGERTKTGFDCQQTSTFGVGIAKAKLTALGVNTESTSKGELCHTLAVELAKISKQQVLFPPYLHPIAQS